MWALPARLTVFGGGIQNVHALAASIGGFHFMINSDLLRYVWMGVEQLALSEGTLNERLRRAALELVTALSEPEGWPTDLLQEARAIEGIMYGPALDSSRVPGTSDAESRDLAERYLTLARRVECAVAIDMAQDNGA